MRCGRWTCRGGQLNRIVAAGLVPSPPSVKTGRASLQLPTLVLCSNGNLNSEAVNEGPQIANSEVEASPEHTEVEEDGPPRATDSP